MEVSVLKDSKLSFNFRIIFRQNRKDKLFYPRVLNINSFAAKYNIQFLVYYEKFTWIQEAIAREKELKKWRRDKKINLIRSFNENFEFLNYHFE